jgi:DNA (cytosine-5)-methyltransferase 1
LDLLGTGIGGPLSKNDKVLLPDHRPLCLNTDDYQRVCQIPKKKGANFRSLKGIIIKEDGITVDIVREPREYLSSGKPLVPDYAVSYMKGRSLKPFGRLWWDEIVPTVVTRAQPHNQVNEPLVSLFGCKFLEHFLRICVRR